MSDQLPRKRIEPLAPPPGQFDRVMGEARYRRHRRVMAMLTVAVVFVAGLGGGLALGRDMPEQIVDAAAQVVRGGPTTSAAPETTTSASSAPKVRKVVNQPAPTELSSPPRGVLSYRGVALGRAGQPAADLYVYVGVPGVRGFVPSGDHIGTTAADGSFEMACPRAPVLLSPWPINAEAKSKARNVDWAATFVGGATRPDMADEVQCTRSDTEVDVTTMVQGAAVEGRVTMPAECEDAELGLWVWLGNDRAVHVNVQDLRDGDRYRVSGLPGGEHTIGANGAQYQVRLGQTGTVHQDVEFACDGDPAPQTSTPAPTHTSTPTGITTPTGTPTPTGTVVPTPPTSTATGTSSTSPDPSEPSSP